MKKRFFSFVFILLVAFIAISVQMYALPEKTYVTNCILPGFDIQQFTIMDTQNVGHYNKMRTIWCDPDSNTMDTLTHPIIITNPLCIHGKPIQDYAEDIYPWQTGYRPNPTKKPKKPKFSEEFYTPDFANVVYSYQLNEDDNNVYYNQYTQLDPGTTVDDGISGNGIVISPNPASLVAVMRFATTSDKFIKIELFSQNGQSAGVIDNSYHSTGLQDIEINTENLSTGVYIVKTMVGTTTYVNKINVIK